MTRASGVSRVLNAAGFACVASSRPRRAWDSLGIFDCMTTTTGSVIVWPVTLNDAPLALLMKEELERRGYQTDWWNRSDSGPHFLVVTGSATRKRSVQS